MKKPVKGNAFHKLNIAVLITCVAFCVLGCALTNIIKQFWKNGLWKILM